MGQQACGVVVREHNLRILPWLAFALVIYFCVAAANAQPIFIVSTSESFSSNPGADETYAIGDVIEVTFEFAETVHLSTPGMVYIEDLAINQDLKRMYYHSGNETMVLKFRYTVEEGDRDTDGLHVNQHFLQPVETQGLFQNASNQNVSVAFARIGTDSGHKVDGVRPTIRAAPSITSMPASGDAYGSDEYIDLSLTFSEAVRVTGTPRLALTVGTVTRRADYSTIMGTTVLEFRYQVAPGDSDSNGLSIAMNALELNSGTITDFAGNAATLTHPALSDQPLHKLQAALQLKIKVLLEGALQ